MKDFYWRIATYPGRFIELTVNFLDIESGSNCDKDFLKVFDGDTTDAPILKTYCSDTSHGAATIISSRNNLYLYFKADGKNDGKGFKITWKAIIPAVTVPGTMITLVTSTNADVTVTAMKATEPVTTSKPEGKLNALSCFNVLIPKNLNGSVL